MVHPNINLDIFAAEPPGKKSHGGCGSCGSGESGSKCGNGLEKIYPTTAVRFGYMRYIGEFTHAPDMKFTCGAKVVIQTKRGIEIGEQVSLTCGGCDKSVTRDQMRAWVETCGQDAFLFNAGRILREAAAADLTEYARILADTREKRVFCQRTAQRHGLSMRVVECEAPFGGERLIFFFKSEERVDFRDLVKELATEYRTRIEMHQVKPRDEARLLADYETCGREVCCKVFLKTLRPISMRMAKLQKATLDPTQVSGRCGRLKCCLRYEHVGYEEMDKRLPKTGVRIRTNHGEGVIVNRQILTQLVQIRTDEDTLVTVVAEDITAVGVPPPPPRPEAPTEPDSTRNRPGEPRRRPVAPKPWASRAKPPERKTPDASSVSGAPDAKEDPSSAKGREDGLRRRRRGRRRRGRRGDAAGGSSGGNPVPPVE